jgi:FkbM family methyltransferase
VREILFYVERSGLEYQKQVAWPTDQVPYEQQVVELRERQCHLQLVDKYSQDTRSQDLLSGVYRDARLIFPFRVENTMYWKVVPHPCSESVTIEARLNGDGHGFEAMYMALLRDAPRDKIVVDIGANLGGYTIFPAVLGFRVVSVEIQPERVREIQLMAKLNGVEDRVQVVHAAAYERTGGTMICEDQRPRSVLVANCNVSSTPETQKHSAHTAIRAPLYSMDDVLESTADVYMYKVDCDGCETSWFEGSIKFLERSGSKVPFYLLEASAHDKWLAEFDRVVKRTPRWYCNLYNHGAKTNPQTIDYEALFEAARSKDLQRAAAIAPVYTTLAALKSAQSDDLWDENFPREYRRSDILVIHVDRI